MNEMQIFSNKEFGNIRTINKGGEAWFVAKDICDCLGISDASKALSRLDDDEKGANPILTPGGKQSMLSVNEYGLYSLVLSSRKPKAKQFKKWITHEVVPSIRKFGLYAADELLSNPDLFISALEALKQERSARLEAENLVEYKNEVINGIVDDMDLLTKRNVLNRVVKHQGANFRKRWSELYQAYREKYGIDLEARSDGYNEKQVLRKHKLSTVKYAEKFGHIENLYKVAVRLYESDINKVLDELKMGVSS